MNLGKLIERRGAVLPNRRWPQRITAIHSGCVQDWYGRMV